MYLFVKILKKLMTGHDLEIYLAINFLTDNIILELFTSFNIINMLFKVNWNLF